MFFNILEVKSCSNQSLTFDQNLTFDQRLTLTNFRFVSDRVVQSYFVSSSSTIQFISRRDTRLIQFISRRHTRLIQFISRRHTRLYSPSLLLCVFHRDGLFEGSRRGSPENTRRIIDRGTQHVDSAREKSVREYIDDMDDKKKEVVACVHGALPQDKRRFCGE